MHAKPAIISSLLYQTQPNSQLNSCSL